MPTHLDEAISKLSDKGVQNRLRAAMRKATLDALKKEGIELSPAEWGELTARMIAAKPDAKRPEVFLVILPISFEQLCLLCWVLFPTVD